MSKREGYQGKFRDDRNNKASRPHGQQDNRQNANPQNTNRSNDNRGVPYHKRRKTQGKFGTNRERKYNYTSKTFEEETLEDVKNDIARIEKEISLEIKEIKSLKL